MANDSQEPVIKVLFLAEKGLYKSNFIELFRNCLMYRSYQSYLDNKDLIQRNIFYAAYEKFCFIDTPEVDPNTSQSQNLTALRSIRNTIHTSGHLNKIVCLLHKEPIYYKKYLELIFTHVFASELPPNITKQVLFVFVKGEEPVEPYFGRFLEKFGTDFSKPSWKIWPSNFINKSFVNLTSTQLEDKWKRRRYFFQEILQHIVESTPTYHVFQKSLSNVVENFLNILTENAFIFEDDLLPPPKSNASESKNYCTSGVGCKRRSVSKQIDEKESNCSKNLRGLIQENRKFLVNTICTLTVIQKEYDLSTKFKRRLQEKIDKDERDKSAYKNLMLLFEEAMKNIDEITDDVSDIHKLIEIAVQKTLVSADHLRPEAETCNCLNDMNLNVSEEEKHLEEKLNNLDV